MNFNKIVIVQIKFELNKCFKIIDLNFCNYYLKFKIIQNRANRIIRLDQFDYFNFILDRHEMTNCKFQTILMNVNLHLKLVLEKHEIFVKFKTKYQIVVDFLMYVMLKIRFDIIYAIFVINRFFFNSTKIHMIVVKRIFRYLKQTINWELVFRESFQALSNYSNSNWVDDKITCRSISNYIFNIDNDALSWQFKRQLIVVFFNCEIEYKDQYEIKKRFLFKIFIDQLKMSDDAFNKFIVLIRCDNQDVMTLILNFVFQARTKHIEIQHYWQREIIVVEKIRLEYVFIEQQIVYNFIKFLSRFKFEIFRATLRLELSV